jgi:2-keto-4-pentenoate hydratase
MSAERLAAALGEQRRAWRATLDAGAERVGWKIAHAIAEIDTVTGGVPLLGYVTTASVLPEGGTYDASGDRELRAETELVIDVGPGGTVLGFAVALELVDVARPPDGLEEIVAANIFHRAVVLGPSVPLQAAPFGRATLTIGGAEREAAEVDVDATAIVARIGELLALVGERIEPGDRILAGSSCHRPAAAGDEVVAAIDGLGRVSARIAA